MERRKRDPKQVAMLASLLVSLVMLVGKITAYFITGSTAIYSDAAESVIHLLATGFAGFSLWYAEQPADSHHPYGHGKIAYFSSGAEGTLIFVAAITIIYTAVRALIVGPELRQLDTGLLITAGLTAINLALGLYLVFTGRKHNSLVLVSNGQHVLTDMWTSLGVIVGVAIVWLTDQVWLDPAMAILVALNIMWTAGKLLRRSVAGLMEEAEQDDSREILKTLERARLEKTISGFHQVRHRRVNDQRWIEYHLLLPGSLELTAAHDISHKVENDVMHLFPDDKVHVTAHLEPDEHEHPKGFSEPDDPLSVVS